MSKNLFFSSLPLAESDPEIARAIADETTRLETNLELIASENYVSPAVLRALGSVMTVKYAEGYPSKRYYGGCEFVDVAEDLARTRARELFGVAHANVQPHCGSAANMAVYHAMLKPGDTVLGMSLAHGGHLTHGSPVNFSGQLYRFVSYEVNPETELLDFNAIEQLAVQHQPKMIVCGGSAYSRTIDFAAFRAIANRVGALVLADIAHPAGLVAAGVHPTPVGYAHFVTTTTHKTLRGPRGGMTMCDADYAQAIDKAIFPGLQGGPLMHVIAAKAVAFREALAPNFKSYAAQIVNNCRALATALQAHGVRIVTGGTDTHLCMIDLSGTDVTGKDAQIALGRAGITVNKNTVPRETRSPFVTSGVRIGTPCVTTRGMQETEMQLIAGWITQVIRAPNDATLHTKIAGDVRDLCKQFPVYVAL